ncbi:MAG: hypothetical protein HYW49_11845 [Deltaproteobacteria bacterium]|nr:hypothetical protein [Deltaproteobacteria bacterium]
MQLTKQNHDQGFLVGEEWLGGVAARADEGTGREGYIAFVVAHRTGEYILNQEFDDLDSALGAINALGVTWRFENASGGCGSGSESENDKCGGGHCGGGCSTKK